MPGNVTGLCWHHRLNQIFVGIGAHALQVTQVTNSTHALVVVFCRHPPPSCSPLPAFSHPCSFFEPLPLTSIRST